MFNRLKDGGCLITKNIFLFDMDERPIPSLPSGLLTSHVFPFVGVKTLKKCACVCRDWRIAVDEDVIWKVACAKLWEGQVNVPKINSDGEPENLYPFSIFPVQALSIKEMKQVLQARSFSCERFLEKTEFQRAIEISQPRLLQGWKPVFCQSKWKCSYVCSVLRSGSNGITRSELVNSKWTMEFRFNGMRCECRFFGDGTYWSTLVNVGNNEKLRWVFLDNSDGSQFDYPGVKVGEYRKSSPLISS